MNGKQINDNSVNLGKLGSGTKILSSSSFLGTDKAYTDIIDNKEFVTKEYVDNNNNNNNNSGGTNIADYCRVSKTQGNTSATYIDTKESTKFYDKRLAREEGKRRRTNIINQVVLNTSAFIYLSEPSINNILDSEYLALPFLDEIDTDIDKYIKGNIQPLINSITNSDSNIYTWIDNSLPTNTDMTIRDYILMSLNDGGNITGQVIKLNTLSL